MNRYTLKDSTITAEKLFPELARPKVAPTRFSELKEVETTVLDDSILTEVPFVEVIDIIPIVGDVTEDYASHEVTSTSEGYTAIGFGVMLVIIIVIVGSKLIKDKIAK